MNAGRCLKLLKRLINRWHGNRKHAAWLLDDNARYHHHAQLFSGSGKRISNVDFTPRILLIQACVTMGSFMSQKEASIDSLSKAMDRGIILGKLCGCAEAAKELRQA